MNKLDFYRLFKSISILVLLLLIPVLLTGCYLLETVNQVPIPTNTAVPEVDLDILPTLPTLIPEEPTETPVPQSNIYFETNSSIFSRMTNEQVPARVNQVIRFIGTVSETDSSQYKVVHSSGVEFTVNCDDYCFYVNDQKKIIAAEKIGKGSRVAVFGTSGSEDYKIINADAIAVDIRETDISMASNKTDMSTFPYTLEYKEYELKSAPAINPLTLLPVEGSLDQNLKDRLQTSLGNRTRFIYGLYGESYSTTIEYDQDNNRDPSYPTRANMAVESNSYSFYDFWFPHIESPYFTSWGIMSYGGDWYLPIRLTVDIDPDPIISELIYTDRTIMSQMNFDETNQYLRSFGFSILSNSLFYFYENEKGFGISLNRVDYDLGFDEIPFGMVDKYQELNPFYADNLITFFGRRGSTWYYVEIKEPESEEGY
jgi:hypothetical protein